QTSIATKIVDKEADSVLAVKNNQPKLAQAIEGFLDGAEQKVWEGVPHTFAEWIEKDHGRLETRRCWGVDDLDCLGDQSKWPQVKTLAMIEAIREINGVVSTERRYYISSLQADAERMGTIVRGHWSVENGLHWILDVAYGEDQARMREGNSAENFSILRRITLNLLKPDKTVKVGIKNKRLNAGWDDAYRAKLLGIQAIA
ncbi:MAG: ISAs1 family transposase, partial [Methylococcaceae bacterium]|nr:ISAs1 family transposase [Methylococcaceae bacterium]